MLDDYVRNNLSIILETMFESPVICFRLTRSYTLLPSFSFCIAHHLPKIIPLLMSFPIALTGFIAFLGDVNGDVNDHHAGWLNSNSTDAAGSFIHNFSFTQSLTQIVNFPTRFPDNSSYSRSLLDLCLVSDPDICFISPYASLGNSDHALVSL